MLSNGVSVPMETPSRRTPYHSKGVRPDGYCVPTHSKLVRYYTETDRKRERERVKERERKRERETERERERDRTRERKRESKKERETERQREKPLT